MTQTTQPMRAAERLDPSHSGAVYRPSGPASLADVLERVLDKGIVVVGDIGVSLLDIELLTLRVRLFIASADTAREMGLDWWESDPFFSSNARQLEQQNRELQERVDRLEAAREESS
jgi:Gas vesicle protein